MFPRVHTQRERYRLALSLVDLEIGDFEFFPLREGETPELALARIKNRIYNSKSTNTFGWSLKAMPDGVRVKKTGILREPVEVVFRTHHAGEIPDHGVRARYLSGCRCILCRTAHAQYVREGMTRYRAAKRAAAKG